MPSQQLSITLDGDLVAFIDQQGSKRSAAIAEAVRSWRDQLWRDEVSQAYEQEVHPRVPTGNR
jgi:metal-responsive CopG/Arc/MetJ family transcriptional regulator